LATLLFYVSINNLETLDELVVLSMVVMDCGRGKFLSKEKKLPPRRDLHEHDALDDFARRNVLYSFRILDFLLPALALVRMRFLVLAQILLSLALVHLAFHYVPH
jgi:hypothetical protein